MVILASAEEGQRYAVALNTITYKCTAKYEYKTVMTLIKTKNGIKGRQPKGKAGLLCSIMICITHNHKWEGKRTA